MATLECRIHSRLDGGDHVIYLCEVIQHARYERPLLLYASGRFGLVVDYPAASTEPDSAQATGYTAPLIKLLWDAWSRVSRAFQADRDAEGLSIDEGRVLSHLERYPGAAADFIARHSFLGLRVVEDAIESLAGAGLLSRLPSGTCSATAAGLKQLESLRRRAAALEARLLGSFSQEDAPRLRRMLERLGDTLPPQP